MLRLEGPRQADAASLVMAIVGEMGYVAQPLETAPPVARWFGRDEVEELSQEEARVLAERWADELAAEALIGETERLIEPLRAALLEAFRSAALTGSVDAVRIDADSIRAALTASEAEHVRLWIARKLGQHTPE